MVLDEHISHAGKLEETSNVFTKGSYHRNITVVYMVHKVFDNGKVQRTMSLNSHYMVLFKNHRDDGQMILLSQHVFPTIVEFFMDSFSEATMKDHGFLILALHPLTLDPVTVLTSIFNADGLENFAPASENKEGNFDLDPSGYINRIE